MRPRQPPSTRRSVPKSAPSARSGRSGGISLSAVASVKSPMPPNHRRANSSRCGTPRTNERRPDQQNYSCVWHRNNRLQGGFLNLRHITMLPSHNPICIRAQSEWSFSNHNENCSNFEQSLLGMMTSVQRWSTNSVAEWSQGGSGGPSLGRNPDAHKQRHPANQPKFKSAGTTGSTQFLEQG
jgi:hypothetical protein